MHLNLRLTPPKLRCCLPTISEVPDARGNKGSNPGDPLERRNGGARLRNLAHGAETDAIAQEDSERQEPGEPVHHGQCLEDEEAELGDLLFSDVGELPGENGEEGYGGEGPDWREDEPVYFGG